MKSMTIGECLKGSWKDAAMALVDRPIVVLTVFAFLLICNCLQDKIGLDVTRFLGAAARRHPDMNASIALGCADIIRAIAISVLYVMVVQFSVLGADEARLVGIRKGYWRYIRITSRFALILIAAIVVIFFLGTWILMHTGVHGQSLRSAEALAVTMLCAVTVFVHFRLSLMFSHAALGAKSRWGAAWTDTEGHFWSIAFTYLLSYLPLIGVGFVYLVIRRIALGDAAGHGFNYWSSLATTLWLVSSVSLSAACSAWIYRRYSFFILHAR